MRFATPNDIEILLHYYCINAPHERENAPAAKETIRAFLKDGILVKSNTNVSGYTVTIKGEAWIEAILSVPYPTLAYINDKEEILLKDIEILDVGQNTG